MNPLLQIGLQTLIDGLLIWVAFVKTYGNQKAKNKADKEDAGELSTIVETIKAGFLQQTESLKAELSYKNQHRINFKSAERDALVNYNRFLSAWMYSLVRFNFDGYGLENYKEVSKQILEINKREYESDLAEAHLLLFMHDQEYLDLGREVKVSIISLSSIVKKAIYGYTYNYSKCELELATVPQDFKAQAEFRHTAFVESHKIEAEVSNAIVEQYRIIHKAHYSMVELIHERLKEIEQTQI